MLPYRLITNTLQKKTVEAISSKQGENEAENRMSMSKIIKF